MAGRTTIRELAKRSGVSVGTVSRALNGYPDVAPETRARIVRLATELEYVDSGRDAMEQLLALDELPTGLVVQSDLMAVGARSRGRRGVAAPDRQLAGAAGDRDPAGRTDHPGFDGTARRDRELVQRQR